MIELFNLANKPELIKSVVDWLFDEWGHKQPYYNKNFWDSWVRSSLSLVDVPQTYVVVDGSELVGTFSLWRCDVQSRQDLFPWLGGVVVRKDRRNEGIGAFMVKEAVQIAGKLGYKELFLSTRLNAFYDSFGWEFIGNVPDENGHVLKLYKFSLNTDKESI